MMKNYQHQLRVLSSCVDMISSQKLKTLSKGQQNMIIHVLFTDRAGLVAAVFHSLYEERDRYIENGLGLKWYSSRKTHEYYDVLIKNGSTFYEKMGMYKGI